MHHLRNDYLMLALIILIALATVFASTTQAAADEPAVATAISDNCEQVASIGILDVYFCETDFGDFYVNSFGFMVPF